MQKLTFKDLVLLVVGLIVGGGIGFIVLLSLDKNLIQDITSFIKQETETGVGSLAPDFELDSLSGDKVLLSDYLGKPVMINFWATWCTPCRYEMPLFESYAEKFGKELVILAVNLQQPETEISKFSTELNITFPILLDSEGKVNKLYRVQGLPTTYFIDRDGRVSNIHIGSMGESQMVNYLKQIGLSDD